MIKIGEVKGTKLNANGKLINEYYTYQDAKQDDDGWVDAKLFMPVDYDLCQLKIKDKKSRMGWAARTVWDGLKLAVGDEILYWKRSKEQ